ncbi:MAG: transporter [Desulfovibrio sp.]|jgi:hypothetical protein|nr:transporter [Desulfovibrio sp.]
MKKVIVVITVFLCCICSTFSLAEETSNAEETSKGKTTEKKSARSTMLFGQPVNVNIGGGGTLPKGRALTILNTSFADKTNAMNGGGKNPNVFSQTWLFKFRYGITDHLELSTVSPFVDMNRTPRPQHASKHLGGFGDQAVALVIAPWNEHQGDPVSASLAVGVNFPTGGWGDSFVPGNGVWGTRIKAGIGKKITDDIKLDTEVAYGLPYTRGNQDVLRGEQFQWNAQARYLFNYFDIGIESSLTVQNSGNRLSPTGGEVDMRNGYTDWFVGPSMNFPIDALSMWAGAGVFFPVLQEFNGPTKAEGARFEFKIGKLW